jgi:hypothetical protein
LITAFGLATGFGAGAGALLTGLTATLIGAFTCGLTLIAAGFLGSIFFTGATTFAFGLITSFLGAATGFAGDGAGAAAAFLSFSAYSASY